MSQYRTRPRRRRDAEPQVVSNWIWLAHKVVTRSQSFYLFSPSLSFLTLSFTLFSLCWWSVYTERHPHQSLSTQVFCPLWRWLWLFLDGGWRWVCQEATLISWSSAEIWPPSITHSTLPLHTVSTLAFSWPLLPWMLLPVLVLCARLCSLATVLLCLVHDRCLFIN